MDDFVIGRYYRIKKEFCRTFSKEEIENSPWFQMYDGKSRKLLWISNDLICEARWYTFYGIEGTDRNHGSWNYPTDFFESSNLIEALDKLLEEG